MECDICCEVKEKTVFRCEHSPCQWHMCAECVQKYGTNRKCPACRKTDFITIEISAKKEEIFKSNYYEECFCACANGLFILTLVALGIVLLIAVGYGIQCIIFKKAFVLSFSFVFLYSSFFCGFIFLFCLFSLIRCAWVCKLTCFP